MRSGIEMAVVLLLVLGAGSAAAQDAPFAGVRYGQLVRVRVVNGPRFVTRMGAAGDPTAGLAASQVDSVWTGRHAVGTGALVGAAIGGVGTFASIYALCSAFNDGNGCDAVGIVALFGLGGAAGGALIGAGVGLLVTKWRLRYTRGQGRVVGLLVGPTRVGVVLRF